MNVGHVQHKLWGSLLELGSPVFLKHPDWAALKSINRAGKSKCMLRNQKAKNLCSRAGHCDKNSIIARPNILMKMSKTLRFCRCFWKRATEALQPMEYLDCKRMPLVDLLLCKNRSFRIWEVLLGFTKDQACTPSLLGALPYVEPIDKLID